MLDEEFLKEENKNAISTKNIVEVDISEIKDKETKEIKKELNVQIKKKKVENKK